MDELIQNPKGVQFRLIVERRGDSPDDVWAGLDQKGKMTTWVQITNQQLPWFNALKNLLHGAGAEVKP